MPEGLVIADEIAFRQERLANLAKAKAVLEARAQERYEAEQAAFDAKVREREAKSRKTGSNPRGRPPRHRPLAHETRTSTISLTPSHAS